MININELRQLAQAATPHVGHACKYEDAHWVPERHTDFKNANIFIESERPQEDAAFYAAANPAAITELLDRLEAAEKEIASWKGLAKQFGNEADALRAKVAEMERQEPVAWIRGRDDHRRRKLSFEKPAKSSPDKFHWSPLYALPGAKGE